MPMFMYDLVTSNIRSRFVLKYMGDRSHNEYQFILISSESIKKLTMHFVSVYNTNSVLRKEMGL